MGCMGILKKIYCLIKAKIKKLLYTFEFGFLLFCFSLYYLKIKMILTKREKNGIAEIKNNVYQR
jgi:hypothetical protein